MSGEDGLLPSIGPVGPALVALGLVAHAVGKRPAGERPRRPWWRPRRRRRPWREVDELRDVTAALVHLSVLLLGIIQAQGERDGSPMYPRDLLEIIRIHGQARADLAALGRGMPFDE